MKIRTNKNVYIRFGKPSRDTPVKGILYEGFVLDVDPVEGENIDGNDRWYKDKNGDYIWSGATTIVPETDSPTMDNKNIVHWGITKLGIDQILNLGITGRNVNVAVFDSGVNNNHDDLKEAIASSIDLSNSNNTIDKTGHGSHVTGIIGARKKHSNFHGVATSCSITSFKVLHDNVGIKINAIIDGISRLISGDALVSHIINMSLEFFISEEKAIIIDNKMKEAFDKGIIITSAANGTSEENISYPAKSQYTITVGSALLKDNRILLSEESKPVINQIDIVAPGINIWSTGNEGNKYKLESGSSMAAAFITGIIALMIDAFSQKNIPYTPAKIKNIIQSTASNIQDTEGNNYPGKLVNPLSIIEHIRKLS